MGAKKGQFAPFFRLKTARGQGLVETAIFFPVLLILLSGMVEFGFLLNDFMVIQDAARNSARYGADNHYESRDTIYDKCNDTVDEFGNTVPGTRDFYRQLACVVNQELEQERPDVNINLGNEQDDVIISVFSVVGGANPHVSARYPTESGEYGWSYAEDQEVPYPHLHRNQISKFTNHEIDLKLNEVAPSTGYLLVELYYSYSQKLKLPWIMIFLPDPILLHTYAIMPLSSAEPTPTPIP